MIWTDIDGIGCDLSDISDFVLIGVSFVSILMPS